MSQELSAYKSIKDIKMLVFDEAQRLFRRENVLKRNIKPLMYSVELNRKAKTAYFIIKVVNLDTYGIDTLAITLKNNFCDYALKADNKKLVITGEFYYGK